MSASDTVGDPGIVCDIDLQCRIYADYEISYPRGIRFLITTIQHLTPPIYSPRHRFHDPPTSLLWTTMPWSRLDGCQPQGEARLSAASTRRPIADFARDGLAPRRSVAETARARETRPHARPRAAGPLSDRLNERVRRCGRGAHAPRGARGAWRGMRRLSRSDRVGEEPLPPHPTPPPPPAPPLPHGSGPSAGPRSAP